MLTEPEFDEKVHEAHVRALLRAIGEDPDREGLIETPRRMLKMLRELCHREPFSFTTFAAEGTSEMVVQTEIPMHSMCEHHCLPFMGTAAVGYIPNGKIVGLSKLARAVAYCSAGLQNQERITRAVADMLDDALKPVGVGVVIRATHTCMSLRGVKAHDSWTTTSCLRGVMLTEASARAEFLALVR
jgi:GTP cyclohydrolase I